MKKFIFGLIATVLLSGVGIAQTRTTTSPSQKIHIEFGRKSKNCEGFGICVCTIDITIEELIALFHARKTSDGRLQIMMSPESYNANKARFSGNYLQVDEDFVVDSNTSRALGFGSDYRIKTGKYTIVFDSSSNTFNCTM
ncbi:MAG: hypothetical protein EOO51_02925 [Flavobacterium sp.]|nr:MAG: hypothetical protein EOO51_02925 [Flavobacterium sp.]